MLIYRHDTSSGYHNPTILETISIHCQLMGQHGRFFVQRQGIVLAPMCLCEGKI